MFPVISLIENSLLSSDGNGHQPGLDAVMVPDPVFQSLRQWIVETDEADTFLTLFVRKGRDYIRVRTYVGLLTLADGTQIEILPKISQQNNARSLLLTMLRHLRHSPFRTLPSARTSQTRLPLWAVFVQAFLDAAEPLLIHGMQRAYVAVERNERYWKGAFQPTRQQRENACHAERLAMLHDVLTTDVPPNRILKTTLFYLQNQQTDPKNRQRIRQLTGLMDTVPASSSVLADLNAIQRSDRLFVRYKPALEWAEALLGNRGYGIRAGRVVTLSLLFPMERIFEDYVAHGMRTYWPEAGLVTVQESSAHLVDEHAGTPKFKLRPDILIRQNGRTLVLDTKWKYLNGHEQTGNYGIEQSDLYQLYAYGKKYEAGDLFLIYPASETFAQPLAVFGYDNTTRLHVVPFDLTRPLANEVEKLAGYALSFQ